MTASPEAHSPFPPSSLQALVGAQRVAVDPFVKVRTLPSLHPVLGGAAALC